MTVHKRLIYIIIRELMNSPEAIEFALENAKNVILREDGKKTETVTMSRDEYNALNVLATIGKVELEAELVNQN